MDWKKLLGSITASVDEEVRLRNAYLAAENRILRQQICGRVPLTDTERKALADIGKKLGRQALEEIATVAKPATILAWHRKCMDQQTVRAQEPHAVGRPRIAKELEDLVVRMARESRSWGYDRIVGALRNLGCTISDQTVGNILKRHGIPPAPERKKTMRWSEFIRIHIDVLGATDFFLGTVWSRLKLVLSFLLVCVHVDAHTGYLTDMAASLTAGCVSWYTDVARWIGAVREHVLTQLLGYGHTARRPLLSAGEIPDRHKALPGSREKVILLLGMPPRPIRDGPARCPPRVHRRLRDDHCEAA
jgi:transposase